MGPVDREGKKVNLLLWDKKLPKLQYRNYIYWGWRSSLDGNWRCRLSLIKMTTSQKHQDFMAEPVGEKAGGEPGRD